MKKILTNLFAILISCAVTSSTLLVSLFGCTDSNALSVKEETTPKSSSVSVSREISVNDLNGNNLLNRIKGAENTSDNNGISSQTSEPTAADDSAPSSASSSATSASLSSTSKATTTTSAVIPKDESKNIEYIKDPDYKSPYYIVVYTGSQSAVVYGKDESGAYNNIVKAFTVSTGRHNSSPTRKGVYKIWRKFRWRNLMGDCWGQYCSSISKDYLFHSVPYAKRSENSLYNASYNNLGKAVSHGCIRMCVRDCKWIYENCPIGTQVHVVWESGPKGASVPKRKSGSKYSGWDPSDQWASGNPYFSGASTTESEPVTTVKTTKASTTAKPATTSKVTSSSADSSQASTQSTSASKKTTSSTTQEAATTTTATTTTSSKPATTTTEEVAVG